MTMLNVLCFQDEDLKRVFLPPPEYTEVTYSHNNIDSPTFEHRHPVHTEIKQPYSDTDSDRKSPWRYEGMVHDCPKIYRYFIIS